MPGMHQKLRLVFWPFRSRSKQCASDTLAFSCFIHMRLNVNVSFDVCKKQTLTKPFTEFIIFISIFCFFVQKNGPINVESHMYEVSKLKPERIKGSGLE